jgi:hypothetical protein
MSQLYKRCREEGRSKDEATIPYVKGIQERLTEEWMDKQGLDSSLYTFLTYKPKEVDYVCNHQTLIKCFGFGGD